MPESLFGGPQPADVSFEAMLACVDRELKMRRQVYPRWVEKRKMSQEAADLEMYRLRAVRDALIGGKAAMTILVQTATREQATWIAAKSEELHRRFPETA